MGAATDLVMLGIIGAGFWYGWQYIVGGGGLPGGGGGSTIGANIYRPTGRKCGGNNHTQHISCSSGSGPSQRYDFDGCGLINYEATGVIRFGGGCFCGDEATIKHYGPGHSDGACCWAISSVEPNGRCSFGGEGPHPSTNLNQMSLGSVGNLQGRTVAIKSIVFKRATGYRQEFYVDTTSLGRNWRRMGGRNFSKWGDNKTTSSIARNQQVEFRCDCSKAKWLSASVQEITAPAALYTEVQEPEPEPALSAVVYKPKMVEMEEQLAYYVPPPLPQVKQTYLSRKLS